MARQIDLDQLMKYPLRRGSERCDEKNADPRFLNGVESILEWAQTLPTLTPPNEWISVEDRLPEGHMQVLMWSARWKIAEAGSYYNKHFWVYTEIGDGYIADNITHWMPLPAPPDKDNHVPAKAPNEALTLDQLREMDGEPVWVEDVKHWALIDIEKGGQWDGVPFAVWAENGVKFNYNVESRDLHCYRRPPEGEEDT